MDKTKPTVIRWISGAVIAAALIASGWLGFKNRGDIPAADNAGYDDHSDITVVTSTDISQSEQASVVSASDLRPDMTGETVTADNPPSPTEETVTLKYVRIKTATNIRAKDSDSSDKVAVLSAGAEAEYISESGKRYQIKYAGNKTGWIIKSCGEVFEKEVTIRHIAHYVSGEPIRICDAKEADDLNAILKNYSTMGASIAVIKDGKVAYHYEYGYANKAKKAKVKENTKFRIASSTKVFTTMLAMTEVDKGLLDIDCSLSDLMGYRFNHPSYPKEKVTMRMLMTHTSGLIDRDGEFSQKLKNITNNRTYYVSPPGEKFLYCNLNFGIAGAVVEKAAGKTISQYAKETFFDPMGIDASYDAKYLSDKSLVADCYAGDKINCSNRYLTRSQERGKPGDTFHLGQGGLLINATDLAKVVTVLMNDGQYEGKQYISSQSLSEMLSKQKVETNSTFDQCIGIRQSGNLIKNRSMYFHNGAAYGVYSLIAFDPADKSGVVIITSGAYTSRKKNTVFAVCDDVLHYTYDEILK